MQRPLPIPPRDDAMQQDDIDLHEPPAEVEEAGPAFGDPRAVVVRWRVPEGTAPTRADVYLTQKVRRLSRARAQRIIANGDFRTPAGPLKPSSKLGRGDAVELWRIPPDEDLPEAAPPGVLFEDDDLLVLDKPGDLAVHPSARYLHRTVTAWLRRYAGGGRSANPCHRLDRETSGVLVCAKSKAAESAVKRAFADGGVQKRYLAVVRGRLEDARVALPLALQGERGLVRIRMIHDEEGLESLTLARGLHYDEETDRTLVLAEPKTGRQHQIRAHLSLIDHPIVGDKLYAMGDAFFDAFTRTGVPEGGGGLEHVRHALHAYEAAFSLDGRELAFRAPLPAELAELLPSFPGTGLHRELSSGEALAFQVVGESS